MTKAVYVVLGVLLFYFVGGTSSLFFQTSSPSQQYSCLPGLSVSQLANITGTMADMTHFYSHYLPGILIPRVPDTPTHALVRQFITTEMRNLGWTIELDSFDALTPFGSKTFTNIIATLKPTATKRIVFACHYDSKLMPGAPNFVGATDSAVPCAILMDTAQKLKHSLVLEDTTPQFIFFDGEEAFVRWTDTDSLYGSRHLALKWQNQEDPNDPLAANYLENIEMFVLLDLIGGANPNFKSYFYNTSTPFYNLYRIEHCLGRDGIVPSSGYQRPMFNVWARPGAVVQDDHIPFIQKGVRVLHLIPSPFPRVWHQPQDDLDHLHTPSIDKFATIFRTYFYAIFNNLPNF